MSAPPLGPVPHIEARDLTLAYGSRVILRDLDFSVRRGDIFIIMGGSGSGKSTLLRHLIGLQQPARGTILFDGTDLWAASDAKAAATKRRFGVLFQHGALWSSMTVAENVALALEQFTALTAPEVREIVTFKLALVGLAGYEDYLPAQLSGGMRKRAGLARAMVLDPEALFLDEPGSGLDPISSKLLDDLILELRDSLGATVIVVTHELASIFAIGTRAVFIDTEHRTITAAGDPRELARETEDPRLRAFLTRGKEGRIYGEAR
jgi:phospholipid/cholesterol/gamma-HCH transport system ATP-binding protein